MKSRICLIATSIFGSLCFSQFVSANELKVKCTTNEEGFASDSLTLVIENGRQKASLNMDDQLFSFPCWSSKNEAFKCAGNIYNIPGVGRLDASFVRGAEGKMTLEFVGDDFKSDPKTMKFECIEA